MEIYFLNYDEFELDSTTTIIQHVLLQMYKNEINFRAS
jgi:hypothetical protein